MADRGLGSLSSRSAGTWHCVAGRSTLARARRSIAEGGASPRRRRVAAESTTSPPPDRPGAVPPVGRPQSLRAWSAGQPPDSSRADGRWHPGCRRCLLKGCERWFLPRRPQARYCSPACRLAARRRRRWHAACRYRATAHGKRRRRDQARRYRDRRRRPAPPPADPPAPDAEPPPPETGPIPPSTPGPPGEGQRPGEIPEKSPGLPCDRPGCYTTFLPAPRSPRQHFCSSRCRQALRRVRQREARLRRRRRRGGRPLDRRRRGPHRTAAIMSSRIEGPSP